MFTQFLRLFAVFCFLMAIQASAATHFVNVGSTNPVSPFSSWATAATAIQDAVDVSSIGDLVLVTNGVYQTSGRKSSSPDITNRVAILNAVTVQSINGPAVTIIQGYQPMGASNANNAVRCVSLGSGALLAGFTLTGGQAGTGNYINGGGVEGIFWRIGRRGFKLYSDRQHSLPGRGVGGGAYNATLVNCLLTGNRATLAGAAYNSILINCTITGNSASNAVGGTYAGALLQLHYLFQYGHDTGRRQFLRRNLR